MQNGLYPYVIGGVDIVVHFQGECVLRPDRIFSKLKHIFCIQKA